MPFLTSLPDYTFPNLSAYLTQANIWFSPTRSKSPIYCSLILPRLVRSQLFLTIMSRFFNILITPAFSFEFTYRTYLDLLNPLELFRLNIIPYSSRYFLVVTYYWLYLLSSLSDIARLVPNFWLFMELFTIKIIPFRPYDYTTQFSTSLLLLSSALRINK